MNRMLICLFATLLSLGCARALPSSGQYPAPVASAAQPGVATSGKLAYAYRGAEAIRKALREVEPDEALRRIPAEGLQIPQERVTANCAAAHDEMAVLVCHFGPAAPKPVAQVIVWYEQGAWRSQLYPQAAPWLAAERQKALAPFDCKIGCHSGVRAARLTDTELLVVVDLGFADTHRAEEVQVLHLKDGLWEVLWVPAGGDWNYGSARVTLAAKGIQMFKVQNASWMWPNPMEGYLTEGPDGVHRRFAEVWIRKGRGFILRDRAEESTPYAALVRVIHYANTGADLRARGLIADHLPPDVVKGLLEQRPRRQQWRAVPTDESSFLLDTDKNGQHDLEVRFTKKDGAWILAEIRRRSR